MLGQDRLTAEAVDGEFDERVDGKIRGKETEGDDFPLNLQTFWHNHRRGICTDVFQYESAYENQYC